MLTSSNLIVIKFLRRLIVSQDGIHSWTSSQEPLMNKETSWTPMIELEEFQKDSTEMLLMKVLIQLTNSPKTSLITMLSRVTPTRKNILYQTDPSSWPKTLARKSLLKSYAHISQSAELTDKPTLTALMNTESLTTMPPGTTMMSTMTERLMPSVWLPNSWDTSPDLSDGLISSDHFDRFWRNQSFVNSKWE